MSQVAAVAHGGQEPAESPLTPESWIKLGMWLFLAGDAMSFGGLLAGYGAMRYASVQEGVAAAHRWPVPADVLGITLTSVMTFLLICSSVTMVKALAALQDGDLQGLKKFLGCTIAGGALFLGMQAYEWTHLINEGLGLTHSELHGHEPFASQFGTTFFMLTGFHGCHVFAGVVYLSCVLLKAMRGGYSPTNFNGVEAVGLYWHFVDLVWILVFTFVYLI